jgi:hypothetical protein
MLTLVGACHTPHGFDPKLLATSIPGFRTDRGIP